MFAKCFLSLAVLLTPFTYAIWGEAEGEHSVQYLARELHEDTGVLRRGLCLLPQEHGLVRPDRGDKQLDELDEEAAPVMPKECRLALVTQIANYGEEIPFLPVKEKELVLQTPHFTDNVTYNLQSESMSVAQTVTDSPVEYLSAAEKYARTVPAEMCDFVRLAAALEPVLISADLLHVYIDGQYRYTVLGLPAGPAAENLCPWSGLSRLSGVGGVSRRDTKGRGMMWIGCSKASFAPIFALKKARIRRMGVTKALRRSRMGHALYSLYTLSRGRSERSCCRPAA